MFSELNIPFRSSSIHNFEELGKGGMHGVKGFMEFMPYSPNFVRKCQNSLKSSLQGVKCLLLPFTKCPIDSHEGSCSSGDKILDKSSRFYPHSATEWLSDLGQVTSSCFSFPMCKMMMMLTHPWDLCAKNCKTKMRMLSTLQEPCRSRFKYRAGQWKLMLGEEKKKSRSRGPCWSEKK